MMVHRSNIPKSHFLLSTRLWQLHVKDSPKINTVKTRVLAALVYKPHPQLSSMISEKIRTQKSTLVNKVDRLFGDVNNKLDEIFVLQRH